MFACRGKETFVLWEALFVDDGMGKENITNEETATVIYRDLERSIFRGGDIDVVSHHGQLILFNTSKIGFYLVHSRAPWIQLFMA